MTDLVAAIFVLLIGGCAVASGVVLGRAGWRARGFAKVKGRVVERGIDPVAAADKAGGRRYEARVTYEYAVAGAQHTGNRIAVTSEAHTRAAAEEALATIPDTVTVYVNPADPTDAVLTIRGLGLAITTVALGLVAVTIGLTLLLT
ncbi:DUF3592 domain-containing protein [Mycobacterium sp. MYCO198283]|uniref:DUF3592 domain-containing protein n=1 Tax=Mycobacterium sp. MYCO198283 TaxID=2883505 RepID=UPI001E2DC155|nr:DUF3592 domain-containing protein [Mycobacterium sp. MYCO198283]MCG5433658.1 DUF3592 domain-containing protein [Mycobacterium sp. MYCO198283]